MKKVYIEVLGCEKRYLDAKTIKEYLIKNNYKLITKPNNADIIIFVTCAFIDTATERSFDRIKTFQRYKAELIIAGCLPAMNKKELDEIFDGKTIITKDLEKIDELFPENRDKFQILSDQNIEFENFNENATGIFNIMKGIFRKVGWMRIIYCKIGDYIFKNLYGEHSHIYFIFRSERYLNFKENPYYYIRISWGCNNNCSYCAIKKAIGPLKSKPIEICIKEFKEGLKKGYKQFIITADDTGSYGLDTNSDFPKLLDEITKIPGDYEISIQDLHPRWVVKYIDELEKIVKRKKITNMYIPIQSGNDRILKLMHRLSNIDKIKSACSRLKKSFPGLVLNTHCIICFPSENEEEFKQTLSSIKNCNFNGGYIFLFTGKTGTKAKNINPKVSENDKKTRLKYSMKYLKKSGYNVYTKSNQDNLLFSKKNI